MEEILIPNIKLLSRRTRETIDRFASFTEAISDTDEGFGAFVNVSKLSVCKEVMIEMSDTTVDFDSLFDILRHLILALVSDSIERPCTADELPRLTGIQKDALKEFRTFSKCLVQKIKENVRKLNFVIKKHKEATRNIEKSKKLCTKYQQKLRKINSELQSSNNLKASALKALQRKFDRTEKALRNAIDTYRDDLYTEKVVMERIRMIHDDIVYDTKYQIKDRLVYGVEYCLYDVIAKMCLMSRFKVVHLIRHMDLEDIADRMLRQCSKKHVIPDVSEYPDPQIFEDYSSSPESSDSGADSSTPVQEISLNCVTGEISIAHSEKNSIDTGYNSEDGRNKKSSGYTRNRKQNTIVRAWREADRKVPGFINLKPGLTIHQKIYFPGEEIAFGCYRPKWRIQNQWGFFFKEATMPLF